MVIDCLTGVQETLSNYGVKHDRFDFESELGWEGSNDKVLEIMKNSDYFVPQTECNDKGVPQGAYLDMDAFIRDQKFKIGKGGYQKDYPPLYVLRPDGSTLYTYRDIVYSFKKASMSDLILNIICSEQDLAQQKVALGMCMMNPAMKGRQYHLSYDLVKLTTGKMSGRRGRYLLAGDLYQDLKDIIKEKMAKKSEDKGEKVDEKAFESVTHEVSAAAMKYALLSCACQTQINFDIAKITDFEDASAPFILYNSTRLRSVIAKYESRVATGELPPLADIKEMEFDELVDDKVGLADGIRLTVLPNAVRRALRNSRTSRFTFLRYPQSLRIPQRHGPCGVWILRPSRRSHPPDDEPRQRRRTHVEQKRHVATRPLFDGVATSPRQRFGAC